MGLATNSLTYYYRKKEDLACACLQRAMDALVAIVDAAARERTLAICAFARCSAATSACWPISPKGATPS